MLGELLFEPMRERAHALVSRVHDEIGDLAIERITDRIQFGELRQRIRSLQKRTVAIVTRAAPQILGRCAEIDDDPVLLEERPILLR
jgi:hypothetical protein